MTLVSLLYHDIVGPGESASSGFGGADADVYKLERDQFAAHLASIAAVVRDCPVVSTPAPPDDSGRKLAFTFDDGGVSALSAADMLEERGWRGYFFVTTDYVGARGFLTAPHVRELDARGHVIGSHSCSHPPRISHCPPAQLDHEWRDSIQALEAITGKPCLTASVPGGYYSRRVARAAAAAGLRLLFTSEPVHRVDAVDGCTVLGRYSIQRGTAAAAAAAIARGDRAPRWRQYLLWNAKKVAKQLGGAQYIAVRKALLRSVRVPR